MSQEQLEERAGPVEPIFNPGEPDERETGNLIKAISSVLNRNADPKFRAYVMGIIRGLREGYEIQSGKDYQGFFPEG
jgi:hypothetical protein